MDSVQSIFLAARGIADPHERKAFLDKLSCGSSDIRDQVEQLLQDGAAADDYFHSGVDGLLPIAGFSFPARRLEDYELLEEVGRGGMGVVFKARQVSLNRIVALKLILSGNLASEEEIVRFRSEAQAVAKLRHPNIVSVYETGVGQGQHYFSMEYVTGRDLAALVRDGPVAPARAARYLCALARAVHYAHSQGILHRDLKPSNIVIDSEDQPRILDFGLAKRIDDLSHATRTGILLGTPACMAPEQTWGGKGLAGRESDIYALGVLLYYLLAGRFPFTAESLPALFEQILNHQAKPPRLLNAAVPVDLETVCLKCLEKAPEQRYPTAQLLAEDLDRFLGGEPVLGCPLSSTHFHQTPWNDTSYTRQYRSAADYYLPDRPRMFRLLKSFFRFHLAGAASGPPHHPGRGIDRHPSDMRPLAGRRSLRVCDLGCGDGIVGAQLLLVDPTIRLTLFDGSEEMLEAARQRFQLRPETFYVHGTFEDLIGHGAGVGPQDFFVSAFAIHHLDLREKNALFARLFDQLQPGGWFLNLDVVLPEHEATSEWHLELWREEILETERQSNSSQSYAHVPALALNAPDNKFSPLGAQLKGMAAAGFAQVECHYRNGYHVVFGGQKPWKLPDGP